MAYIEGGNFIAQVITLVLMFTIAHTLEKSSTPMLYLRLA
jgi:hypothetical protein